MGGGERKRGPERKGRKMRGAGKGVRCNTEGEEKKAKGEKQRSKFLSQVSMPESVKAEVGSLFLVSLGKNSIIKPDSHYRILRILTDSGIGLYHTHKESPHRLSSFKS